MEDHVLNKYAGNPQLVETRVQADQPLVTAVTTEADMGQPTMRLTGPADLGQRQPTEPASVNPLQLSLKIKRATNGGQLDRWRRRTRVINVFSAITLHLQPHGA